MARAGCMRHRVSVQTLSEARAADGGVTESWSTTHLAYADIQPIRGREFFNAEAVNSDVTHKVTIRYRAGITPKMRLLFGTRELHITSVINVNERNDCLELMCKEVVDGS